MENALVVEGRIGNILLRRILIDNGSSVNLMTLDKFRALGGSVIDMKLVSTPLLGLGWSLVEVEGSTMMTLSLGMATITKSLGYHL